MKGKTSSRFFIFSFKRFCYSQLSVLPRHLVDGVGWNEIGLLVVLAQVFAISLKSSVIGNKAMDKNVTQPPSCPRS